MSAAGASQVRLKSLDRQESLSSILRRSTRDVHREAERSGIVADVLRGRATIHSYAIFLRNLAPVYAMLEQVLEAHAHLRIVAAFADPRLCRLEALLSDLAAIVGADWATLPLFNEAERYTEAIADAATHPSSRLVAHAYARYLGDLSGGQILKPLLMRSLGLPPAALAFYDFPAIADLDAVKSAMRDSIDSIPTDGREPDRLLCEAIVAFQHNIDLSKAIQGAVLAGSDASGDGSHRNFKDDVA